MKKPYSKPSVTVCLFSLSDAILSSVIEIPTEPWEMEILGKRRIQSELENDGLE